MEVHLQNKTKPMYYYCTYKNDVNSFKGLDSARKEMDVSREVGC